MKFGIEWVLIALLLLSAISYIFLRARGTKEKKDSAKTPKKEGATAEKSALAKTLETLKDYLLENWTAKLAAIAGYILFLVIIYNSFPEFWKTWSGIGVLFKLDHAVVGLLIILPIWRAGHWFARWMVFLAVIFLGISSVREIMSGKSALVITAPGTNKWSEVVEIPNDSLYDVKVLNPTGSTIYIATETDKVFVQKGNVKPTLPKSARSLRFMSAETNEVKVRVEFKPLPVISATGEVYTPLSDDSVPLKLSYGVWSRTISIPAGQTCDTKTIGPEGTKIFINVVGGETYMELWRHPPHKPQLFRVFEKEGGQAMEPCEGINAMNGSIRFMSGERDREVTLEYVLR